MFPDVSCKQPSDDRVAILQQFWQ